MMEKILLISNANVVETYHLKLKKYQRSWRKKKQESVKIVEISCPETMLFAQNVVSWIIFKM